MRRLLLLFFAFLAFGVRAAAAATSLRTLAGEPLVVPAVLRPWIPWVLTGDEDVRCPRLVESNEALCVWPTELALDVRPGGATFRLQAQTFRPAGLALPGDDEHPPLDVTVDGRALPVTMTPPQVLVPAGRHVLMGRFAWVDRPDVLSIGADVALVRLTIDGRPAPSPARDSSGRLLFGVRASVAPPQEDAADVVVQRRLDDDVPLRLQTRLVLTISGREREIWLARPLPDGFVAHEIDSPLPIEMAPDGRLRVQGRPGTHIITLDAHALQRRDRITRPPVGEGIWDARDEIWSFAARPQLRGVEVSGAPPIDPAQTTLPTAWRALPAFVVTARGTLVLDQRSRGDSTTSAPVSFKRELWLHTDGHGYAFADEIVGAWTRPGRFDAAPSVEVGQIRLNGEPAFITRGRLDAPAGIELRGREHSIKADGRIEGGRSRFPAVGWAAEADTLNATLHVPPGWRAVYAHGADRVAGTWVEDWSLIDVALVVMTATVAFCCLGPAAGVTTLFALALTVTEPDAPRWLWLALALASAGARQVLTKRFAWITRLTSVGLLLVVAADVVSFATKELNRGLYPGATDPMSTRYSPGSKRHAARQGRGFWGLGASDVSTTDELEGLVGHKMGAPYDSILHPPGLAPASASAVRWTSAYDPSVIVQTGYGVPSYQGDTVALGWNGRVHPSTSVFVLWAPPWLNAVLAFMRVALLAGLLLLIVRRIRLRAAAGALALWIVCASPTPARAAEVPSAQLLKELQAKVTAPPSCEPNCAAVDRLTLRLRGELLHMELTVAVAAPSALLLPGSPELRPLGARVDGRPAPLMRRDDGQLAVAVNRGAQRVEVETQLPAKPALTLSLPFVPRYTRADAVGARVEGIDGNGQAARAIEITRLEKPAPETGSPNLPPLLEVRREVRLGVRWEVHTTVRRIGGAASPVQLDVPLLPGERVVTAGTIVDEAQRTAQVSIAQGVAESAYQSQLDQAPRLELQAPGGARWFEVWEITAGATFHVETRGVPAQAELSDPQVYRPWPGEKLILNVTKPSGAGGPAFTVDNALLELAPGPRTERGLLRAFVRASRGSPFTVTLPSGAVLDSSLLDDVRVSTGAEGQKLNLLLTPGEHSIDVAWHVARGIGRRFTAPAVALPAPISNAEVVVNLRDPNRWVLWTRGPAAGPAVRAWSLIALLIIVSCGLARTRLTPLGAVDWVVLGLGLLPLGLPRVLVLPVVLLALGLRRRALVGDRHVPRWAYNLSQLVLAFAAAAAVGVLVSALEEGVLRAPVMGIVGAGSSETVLRWYEDRADGAMPRVEVISAPLWVYRLAVLAWAAWLAFAIARWWRFVRDSYRLRGLYVVAELPRSR